MSKMSDPNYYDILESDPKASFEDLKRKYKQLVLQYHPDKNEKEKSDIINELETSLEAVRKQHDLKTVTDDNTKKFLKIVEAWNTLKDIERRRQYDAKILLENIVPHLNIFQEVTLHDMRCEKTEELTSYTLTCRCGGTYIFEDAEPLEDEDTEKLIIDCSECSLVILIQIKEPMPTS